MYKTFKKIYENPLEIKIIYFKIIDIIDYENLLYLIQKYITKHSKINLHNVYKDAELHIKF